MKYWLALMLIIIVSNITTAQDTTQKKASFNGIYHELGFRVIRFELSRHYDPQFSLASLNLQNSLFYRVTNGRRGLRFDARYTTKNRNIINELVGMNDSIISYNSKELEFGIGFQYSVFENFQKLYLLTDINYRRAQIDGVAKDKGNRPANSHFTGSLQAIGVSPGLGIRTVFFKKFVISTEFVTKIYHYTFNVNGYDSGANIFYAFKSSSMIIRPDIRLYVTLAL